MKRLAVMALGLLVVASTLVGRAHQASGRPDAGWLTLFDGTDLDGWTAVGDANWTLTDGAVQADSGLGFLVSKNAYTDFLLRVEFWVNAEANSGIFVRCADPKNITPDTSYEVNIFDQRPDPSYGTGAIVNVATVSPMPKAGGRWNTYEITVRGTHLTVTLNGVRTVDVQDGKFAGGPIALQYGAGVVKFRRVQVKPL